MKTMSKADALTVARKKLEDLQKQAEAHRARLASQQATTAELAEKLDASAGGGEAEFDATALRLATSERKAKALADLVERTENEIAAAEEDVRRFEREAKRARMEELDVRAHKLNEKIGAKVKAAGDEAQAEADELRTIVAEANQLADEIEPQFGHRSNRGFAWRDARAGHVFSIAVEEFGEAQAQARELSLGFAAAAGL